MAAAATEVALRAVGFADPPPPRGFLFPPRFVGICGARLWVSECKCGSQKQQTFLHCSKRRSRTPTAHN